MVLQRFDPFRDLRQMEDTMNRLWRGIGTTHNYREGTEDWNILMTGEVQEIASGALSDELIKTLQ